MNLNPGKINLDSSSLLEYYKYHMPLSLSINLTTFLNKSTGGSGGSTPDFSKQEVGIQFLSRYLLKFSSKYFNLGLNEEKICFILLTLNTH